MIRIFTENSNEHEVALKIAEFLSKNIQNKDICIDVNPPSDSLALNVWSVDDIFDALEKQGVITTSISDSLILDCISELDLANCISDASLSAGNDFIDGMSDIIIEKINEKAGKCHHQWPGETDGKKKVTCASCGVVSSPSDFKCNICDKKFSLYELELQGENCCPHCNSMDFSPANQTKAVKRGTRTDKPGKNVAC